MATAASTTSSLTRICPPLRLKPPFSHHQLLASKRPAVTFTAKTRPSPRRPIAVKDQSVYSRNRLACGAGRRNSPATAAAEKGDGDNVRRVLQSVLWVAEGVYIFWLFLLPYAPGDPVWAISPETVNSLVGLSLNFFFILPLMNSEISPHYVLAFFWASQFCALQVQYGFTPAVGIRLIDAPVLHPVAEGLFNFVIGWTFMFAPLLFADSKRDRFKGSLDVLWGFQMFLTNTFLIPYMAIRLNEADAQSAPRKPSQLASVMTKGAPIVGLIGGAICLISALWAISGRSNGNFGDLANRWDFLVSYLGSERLAYAFIWDICLYIIFQPWLIGDNLQNVQKSKVGLVNYLRFVPVLGLVVYLVYLNLDEEL
ncbi:hypothetical protein RHMOL_Rhmol09G0160700 [Rhododendron molle]|uniref:Uncharacterized protein n=1 Tax=Rhododendron molle TaxID=49168 RepID=A0ACC0MFB3_RHOML|nr:hypothetical protein RHMOL_Rhmol09G0160700 [Rhododendron molle]